MPLSRVNDHMRYTARLIEVQNSGARPARNEDE